MDIAISFPGQGQIRLQSHALFAEPGNDTCREFLQRVFQASEITDVTINSHQKVGSCPHADLRFCPDSHAPRGRAADLDVPRSRAEPARRRPRRPRQHRADGRTVQWKATSPAPAAQPEASTAMPRPTPGPGTPHGVAITRVTPVRNEKGQIRFFRYGSVVTNWEIKHEIPGRLRLKNPVAPPQDRALPGDRARADERPGDRLVQDQLADRARSWSSTTRSELTRDQMIEILDAALADAEHPDRARTSPTCTCRSARPRCRSRRRPSSPPRRSCRWPRRCSPTRRSPPSRRPATCSFKEKRLGVDVLDAIVVIGCLGTMAIFPGAVLCWCLSFGRVLVKKTQDNSKKLLLNAFGKQPRYVWLYRDGVEVQVSLDRLQKGDIIVVNTGEVVPVDGHRRRGHGDDRPARPDRRVDAGREGRRRPRLRLDGDGRRQGLRRRSRRRAARRPRPRSARSSTTRPATS